jgi:hypothetical protein
MTQGEVRTLALGLPEAEEKPHFDRASFRVRGKIFATLSGDGDSVVLKLALPVQESALQSWPEAVILPKHWSRHGWTQLQLAAIPAAEMSDLVRHAWRQVVPKALIEREV